ncbi:beta-N-acetylhexosaminidase [Streptomyces niveus]|uniref:beta-N-acetylhexosaminidase n=1 Tax=Streptomyces niveus TaxID=193462 RepID=UPI00343EAB2C
MELPLIPAPATAATHEGVLAITGATRVLVESAGLADIAARFTEDVRIDSGISLSLGGGAAGGPHIRLQIDDSSLDSTSPAAGLRADGKSTTGDADERHGLQITDEGARVWGSTKEAVYRGLTTLRQLIATHAQDGVAELPAARIVDGPRFAWRGLSLDVVRTFHGPATVRRVIDMCALHKLNVLHLHLTDDQGWRIEVPSRPALTGIGARGAADDRPGGFYTQADIAGLVAYAAESFVTVVPEIDMPGHATAAIAACPELASPDAASIDLGDGNTFELKCLDPARDETWAFVEDVLDAVVAQFPQTAYLHIGGDEAFGMPDEAHAAFVERTAALVRARGKRVVGWQEIARAAIGRDDVVQYWMAAGEIESAGDTLGAMVPLALLPVLLDNLNKAKHDVPSARARGAQLLVSPSTWLYFDRPHADASSDPDQEAARARLGMQLYPPTSIRSGVEWDPMDDTPDVLGDDEIVGVEAAIWCETLADDSALELMLLPRLAALAEKGWAQRRPTEWDAYAARLGRQSAAWRRRDWNWFRSVEVDWA